MATDNSTASRTLSFDVIASVSLRAIPAPEPVKRTRKAKGAA